MTGVDVTTYTDAGLAEDTTYCYRVRSYNAAGDSDYSNVVCGTTGRLTLKDFVTRFYLNVLDRSPDPDGLAGWVTFLQANCNAQGLDSLARGFFDSPEFRLIPQTLTSLVTKLYITLLGRNPDPDGLAAWAAILREVRLDMATEGFIPSQEFRSLVHPADTAAVTNLVTRLYAQILRRSPVPEELAGWVDFATRTGDFNSSAQGFLLSPEIESRPLTFREYVTILYRAFLDREPDGPGLDGWEEVLRSTLGVISTGFVSSAEFQSHAGVLCGP